MRSIRRLALISDATAFGGAERYLIDLAQAARRQDVDACIWWLRQPRAEAAAFPAELAGETPVLCAALDAPSAMGLIREFRAMLRTVRPHAVLINASPRPHFWMTAWLAWQAGLPAIWVHHMVEGGDPPRRPGRWLHRHMEGPQFWRIRQAVRHQLAAFASDWVVTSNEDDRRRIARRHAVSPRKLAVVAPGIDGQRYRFDAQARQRLREEWYGPPAVGGAEPLIVGAACRLVPGKHVDHLIEAVASLRSRGLQAIGVIAGEGPERDRLQRCAHALHVADAIRFLGQVSDMPAFYSALDVHVSCSESESFGLTLAEAMACERPVVTTPTAGGCLQVEHLKNGWLLRAFGAAELAEALFTLMHDQALRAHMSQRARMRVLDRYAVETTLKRLLKLLRTSVPPTQAAPLLQVPRLIPQASQTPVVR